MVADSAADIVRMRKDRPMSRTPPTRGLHAGRNRQPLLDGEGRPIRHRDEGDSWLSELLYNYYLWRQVRRAAMCACKWAAADHHLPCRRCPRAEQQQQLLTACRAAALPLQASFPPPDEQLPTTYRALLPASSCLLSSHCPGFHADLVGCVRHWGTVCVQKYSCPCHHGHRKEHGRLLHTSSNREHDCHVCLLL